MYFCLSKVEFENKKSMEIMSSYSDSLGEEKGDEYGILMRYRADIGDKTGIVVTIYENQKDFEKHYKGSIKESMEMMKLQGHWTQLNHGDIKAFSVNNKKVKLDFIG
jgi:hypothetical protein